MFDLFDDVSGMISSSARNFGNYFKEREAISTVRYQAVLNSLKKEEVLIQISATMDQSILKEFKSEGATGDNPFDTLNINNTKKKEGNN